jgi:hypothetical protein
VKRVFGRLVILIMLLLPSVMKPAAAGKRFTLRLGQGFRFKDGAVVVAKPDEQPDIVFKYLAPQGAGQALRYNEQSQQVETGSEPALTSAVPLLISTHISAFDTKPDVARITSGDIADYWNQAPVFRKMTNAGISVLHVSWRKGGRVCVKPSNTKFASRLHPRRSTNCSPTRAGGRKSLAGMLS